MFSTGREVPLYQESVDPTGNIASIANTTMTQIILRFLTTERRLKYYERMAHITLTLMLYWC
jgi:hypothetical protein